MKTKIGIIFGGRSGEHEISIRSAKTVIEQIDKEKYDVIPIAITQMGHWLNPMESLQRLPESIQESLSESVKQFPSNAIALIGDTKYQGLTRLETSAREEKLSPLDVVFRFCTELTAKTERCKVCLKWLVFRISAAEFWLRRAEWIKL